VAARELVVWLEGFERRAREDQGDEKSLLNELVECEKQVPAVWWASAELCACAGAAFAELGQMERAIDYFTRASSAEHADAPIWVLEQLVSCKIRLAGELAAKVDGHARAIALLGEAETTLTNLLALGRSSERLALQGALMKRRAMLAGADADARRAALQGMSQAYAEAFTRSISERQPLGVAYPLANQIAAEIVLGWARHDGAAAAALVDTLQKVASAQATTHTDFFSLAAVAEAALLRALCSPSLDDATRQQVQEEYVNALSRGITTRQLDSVRTMLNFFSTLIAAEYPDGRMADVAKQLSQIDSTLVAKA
jgi:hypothetical protein